MNGAAHIMNDEATRKYLQAIKRLQTFMQRAYPTDPSRSVDFDGFRDAGLGAKGAGSDKAVSCFQPCTLYVVGSARACANKACGWTSLCPAPMHGNIVTAPQVGNKDLQSTALRSSPQQECQALK